MTSKIRKLLQFTACSSLLAGALALPAYATPINNTDIMTTTDQASAVAVETGTTINPDIVANNPLYEGGSSRP